METNRVPSAVFWVLGVVLLGISGYFLYAKTNTPSITKYTQQTEAPGVGVVGNPSLNTDPFDVTITYTDEGYTPNEITIKKGTRVRFLNASKEMTWPASGVHPTHTLYPEKENSDCLGSSFDACQDLKQGEFFDFTFNYVGEWRYHDHSHAYNTGVITVTAE